MLVVTLAVFEWGCGRARRWKRHGLLLFSVLVAAEIAYLYQARHYTKSALATETVSAIEPRSWSPGYSSSCSCCSSLRTDAECLRYNPLSAVSWLMIVALAAVVFFAVEAEKAIWRWRGVQRF